MFSAYEQEQDEKKKQRILEQAAQQLNTTTAQLKEAVTQWYKDNQSIGTQQDVAQYGDLIRGYDPNEFVYETEDFDNNYDVNDYYAPNRQAIIDKTADAVQHTAAGAGIGRGTGAANMIATNVADKNEELYRDALNAMNQDRQFAYNLWNSKANIGMQRLNQLKSAKDTQLSLYGNLAEDYQNFQQSKLQTMMDLDKQKMNNDLTLTLASI